ncbi:MULTISPECIES: hypothetical protein [unclassified Nonomuraea]|uniref:hypothetical protein n=1 Tax=unclassified Nonomuraea TaxID=2593643 RepID=UPI0033F227B7
MIQEGIDVIDQLRERLAELTQEYQLGEAQLRDVVRQDTLLRETLLRISGAMQVLEELCRAGDASEDSRPQAAVPERSGKY